MACESHLEKRKSQSFVMFNMQLLLQLDGNTSTEICSQRLRSQTKVFVNICVRVLHYFAYNSGPDKSKFQPLAQHSTTSQIGSELQYSLYILYIFLGK